MSLLTLEFTVLFLKVLNIDFPLILISLNVVETSLTLVIVGAKHDALKEWKSNIFKIIDTRISF